MATFSLLLAKWLPRLKLAYRIEEAAAALGVSPRHLRRHVLPELRTRKAGRVVLICGRSLQAYVQGEQSDPLPLPDFEPEAKINLSGRL